MSKIMLVNVTHVEESRVAIVDDGVLAAYEIETLNRAHIKGNIYNAVVDAALPSLEAAFLRLGPDLKGFLPLDEVNFKLLPSRGARGKGGRIGQHLVSGQKLIAQVVREPFAGKPPTVSTFFSLPGRYLVLMPGVDSAGISRKIADGKQRDRLKKIVDELRPPEGFGLIVRTAGVGQTKTELQRDLRYLLRLWEAIQRASEASPFPGLVYREHDLVIRTIRDYFTPDIREVWIDSKDTYERALEFVRDVMPTKAKILKLYTGARPLFNKFNLEEQIESIYKRRVGLPSGGEIVIDGTEALTAIDVNSAKSSGRSDAEENATNTNVEAAKELARQLRLRDLGGLVVVDFIDMLAKRNQKKVEKAMRDAMKGDKAKYDVTPISKLGLMEIARQRLKGAKMGASYATCPTCEGYGLIKNVEAAALAALRKLQTRGARAGAGRVRMNVPPEVAMWILNNKREQLHDFERRHQLIVDIVPDAALQRHECRIESAPRTETDEVLVQSRHDRPAPPMPPDASEMERAAKQAQTEAEPASEREGDSTEEATAPRKRRRRRRRHSRAGVLASPDETVATPTGDEDAALTAAAKTGADGAEESPAPRRKRRRRRRRSGGEASQQANGAPSPDKGGSSGEPAAVPQGVVSNELMPAAVGAAGDRPKRGSGRGGSRRKRRAAAR